MPADTKRFLREKIAGFNRSTTQKKPSSVTRVAAISSND